MGTKQRAVDIGTQRATSIIADLSAELRRARADHGLSQSEVARAARLSRAQVGRVERCQSQRVSILVMARLLAVVGLELSARAYPNGSPIRDQAQLALLARFRATLPRSVRVQAEVPLPIPCDLRAWDLVLTFGGVTVAAEAETRPRDVQALQRRVALKLRDDPAIQRVVLLLSDTRHNRTLLRVHGPALRSDFPVAGAEMARALKDGRDPGGSGIMLL